jgi:hypothetical protein
VHHVAVINVTWAKVQDFIQETVRFMLTTGTHFLEALIPLVLKYSNTEMLNYRTYVYSELNI